MKPTINQQFFRLKQEAEALRKKNKIDEAIATYEKALCLIPNDIYVLSQLGFLHSYRKKQGDMDRAIEYHQKALKVNEKYESSLNGLCYIYNYLNNQEQLNLYANKLAIVNPHHPKVKDYLSKGSDKNLLKTCKFCGSVWNPERINYEVCKSCYGIFFEFRRNVSTYEDYLEYKKEKPSAKLEKEYKHDVHLAEKFEEILYSSGNTADAEYFKRLKHFKPKLKEAISLYQSLRLVEADELFTELIAMDPKKPLHREREIVRQEILNLADKKYAEGEYSKAKELYEYARSYFYSDIENICHVLTRIGICEIEENNEELGLSLFDEALEKDKKYASTLVAYAVYYKRKGGKENLQKAIAFLDRNPLSANCMYYKAKFLENSDLDKALKIIDNALATITNTADMRDFLYLKASFQKKLSDTSEEYRSTLQELLHYAEGKEEEILSKLAFSYVQTDEIEKALRYLQAIENPDLFDYCGLILCTFRLIDSNNSKSKNHEELIKVLGYSNQAIRAFKQTYKKEEFPEKFVMDAISTVYANKIKALMILDKEDIAKETISEYEELFGIQKKDLNVVKFKEIVKIPTINLNLFDFSKNLNVHNQYNELSNEDILHIKEKVAQIQQQTKEVPKLSESMEGVSTAIKNLVAGKVDTQNSPLETEILALIQDRDIKIGTLKELLDMEFRTTNRKEGSFSHFFFYALVFAYWHLEYGKTRKSGREKHGKKAYISINSLSNYFFKFVKHDKSIKAVRNAVTKVIKSAENKKTLDKVSSLGILVFEQKDNRIRIKLGKFGTSFTDIIKKHCENPKPMCLENQLSICYMGKQYAGQGIADFLTRYIMPIRETASEAKIKQMVKDEVKRAKAPRMPEPNDR